MRACVRLVEKEIFHSLDLCRDVPIYRMFVVESVARIVVEALELVLDEVWVPGVWVPGVQRGALQRGSVGDRRRDRR